MIGEQTTQEESNQARCDGHDDVVEQLRARASDVLKLLEPWIDQVRDAPTASGETPATCASCPLCALMALLRGERSEMAVRIAEQAAGLVTVLKAALAEGNGPGTDTSHGCGPDCGTGGQPAGQAAEESRDVQRIPVSRVDGGTASSHR